jgi:hypothetical protein
MTVVYMYLLSESRCPSDRPRVAVVGTTMKPKKINNYLRGHRAWVFFVIIFLCLAALLVIGVNLLSAAAHIPGLDVPGANAKKLVLGKLQVHMKKTPTVPETMNVYTLETMYSTRAEFQKVASALGVPGRLEYIPPRGILHANYKILTNPGGFSTDLGMNLYSYRSREFEGYHLGLPADDHVGTIAMREMARRGLLPQEAFVSGLGGIQGSKGWMNRWRKYRGNFEYTIAERGIGEALARS